MSKTKTYISLVFLLFALFPLQAKTEEHLSTTDSSFANAKDVQQTPLGKPIAKSKRGEFVTQHFDSIISICQGRRDVIINHYGVNVLCYHGAIERSEEVSKYQRSYAVAYINSSSGDTKHAFEIGRELFRNGVSAIVDGHCHSACGTYLLPSIRDVHIATDTVMSMHTNLPRTPADFVKVRFPKQSKALKEELDKNGPNSETIASYLKLVSQYDPFFDEYVIGELEYFKAINTDISYTYRYREIFRTLQKRPSYKCKPSGGLYLILGPKYLAEFDIRTSREWFPLRKSEYAKLLPASSRENALIFDFEEHPFWVPERGLVEPSDCMQG